MSDGIDVLYIDDEPALRDLTAEMLERVDPNITVRTESDPTIVPDRLAEERFDCLVSDYNMPSIDGLGLCERVRRDHPEVPYFLFTNHDQPAVIEAALDAGVTDYVEKQPGIEHYKLLANRISNAVQHNRKRRRIDELVTED